MVAGIIEGVGGEQQRGDDHLGALLHRLVDSTRARFLQRAGRTKTSSSSDASRVAVSRRFRHVPAAYSRTRESRRRRAIRHTGNTSQRYREVFLNRRTDTSRMCRYKLVKS